MRFTPKNGGMELSEIVSLINDEAERLEIKFYITESQMPYDVAQSFVDDEYDLREEMVDAREEYFVDARAKLITKVIKKLKKVMK